MRLVFPPPFRLRPGFTMSLAIHRFFYKMTPAFQIGMLFGLKWLHFTENNRAGSILVEIEKSTILTQFFKIEIVKKSICGKLKKIEIEPKNREGKKALK